MVRFALVCLLLLGCTSAPVTPTPSPTSTSVPTSTPPTILTSPPTVPTRAPTPVPITVAPSPTVVPTPRATPRVVFTDGTHLVPDEVAPGTYRTISYTIDCYWTRLSGFSSGLADWVASGIGSGYRVVTIGETDAGFDSDSCGGWTDDLSAVGESVLEIRDGTYIVGRDLEPGTYLASSGTNCSWARLSGFGGLDAERIDEALVTGGTPPTVTVEPTDVGFASDGCGTWTGPIVPLARVGKFDLEAVWHGLLPIGTV